MPEPPKMASPGEGRNGGPSTCPDLAWSGHRCQLQRVANLKAPIARPAPGVVSPHWQRGIAIDAGACPFSAGREIFQFPLSWRMGLARSEAHAGVDVTETLDIRSTPPRGRGGLPVGHR
jgi:hypothetical protein